MHALDEMRRDYPDDFLELIDSFRQSVADIFRGFAENVVASDPARHARLAHSLKSTAGAFGARRLSDMAAILEKNAKEGVAADPAKDIDPMRQEYARVAEILDRLAADPAGRET
jgi:HPt (histidine-containing phosphotransfer) domain-containing protein